MTECQIVLAPPPRKAADEDPWRDDLLNAQSVTNHLSRYAKALITGGEGAVIALNGGYGTGKTFVLERWLKEMKAEGQVTLYYNAWENDDDDDPLVSLLELLASESSLSTWYEGAKAGLNEVLTAVLRHHTGVDVRSVASAVGWTPAGPLDSRRERRECRKDLRRHLDELVRSTENLNGESAPGGVVIVIDELDRCRPTFAMQLLERTKHILNVPGIVFVFGMDMKSLREFVKIVHGDIDADGYLLRMFHVVLNMPEGVTFGESTVSSQNAWLEYLRKLAGRHGLSLDDAPNLNEQLTDAFSNLALLAEHGGFTPREMEGIVRTLVCAAWLASELAPEGRHYRIVPDVMAPMAMAKVKDHEAYRQMVSRPNGAPAVIDCLRKWVDGDNLGEWKQKRMDDMEMMLYRACHPSHSKGRESKPLAYAALEKLAAGQKLTDDEKNCLSHKAARIDKEKAADLLEKRVDSMTIDRLTGSQYAIGFGTVRSLASLIGSIWAPG